MTPALQIVPLARGRAAEATRGGQQLVWHQAGPSDPGLAGAEVRRLRQLEDENRRLKQLVADLTLDKAMLQGVLRGKS